ncbi:hypothetical protein GOBAR_DD16967 [Gossypium barbadense]|nr:hypothetical protein GOBAR_DD16967 [Gossypium barbadense]
MKLLCLYSSVSPVLPLPATGLDFNGQIFSKFTVRSPGRRFSSRLTVNSRGRTGEEPLPPILSSSSAYAVLGVDPNCSAAELKAAFRAKVKQYHPDVNKDGGDSDTMIRRVIQAYEMLCDYSRSEIIERECLDPFDSPESEAFDVFVNEVLCVGKHGEDYRVQLAVGQCPRNCIHFVTPSQRIILEELLDSNIVLKTSVGCPYSCVKRAPHAFSYDPSTGTARATSQILNVPFDISAEADLLYSLIVKAKFENNRYQKPKKQPKTSTKNVD